MASVHSTMLELGTKAPGFSLRDTRNGNIVAVSDYQTVRGLLVIFICNHCPYVKLIKKELVKYAEDYQSRGVAVVAISSNDAAAYPADSPEKMKEDAAIHGYPFPYLFDETQETAKKYKAACTPDLFLFDENHELFYRGQFDSSRPKNNIPANGEDIRMATDLLLDGKPAPEKQIPGIGCNIKWKKGNEPSYFG